MNTQPILMSVNQTDRPIRFRAIGEGHNGPGLTWIIQPGDRVGLGEAIDMVNWYGGPDFWEVSEIY